MRALKVVPQGDRLQRAVPFQKREKVVLPIAFKRIAHGAPMSDLAL
jgi:hypothetical protein